MKTIYKTGIMWMITICSLHATAQVPTLNSYPGASAVILLDFDGHLVSGTSWNVNGDINAASSGLNNTQITEVFNRVAEDYRPFNINVTTSESAYTAAPASRRMRILITTTHSWYGTGAGGVAYLNSFTWGNNTPAWVFSALLNYNVKNIAEASSHEAGHTLGLRHQSSYDGNCVKLSDYNWGQGTGEIGWAPIMGAGYNQNMTLWHNGPNSIGCNNIQSDLSIITNATNGFGYRPDDHTDAYATATTATFTNNQFTINGVVSQSGDKDLFKFAVTELSQFQLNAIPYNVGTGNAGSNLDLQVTFLDGAYNQLGIYNPGTLLSSIIDTVIETGTYYLRVEGKGNIYAPEYASLGSFALEGAKAPATGLPLRRLELKGQIDRETHTLNWLIDADENVIRQVIEVSADGRNFSPLVQPGNNDRTYNYRPAENRPLRYRVHVTFDNNKDHYSNVITIRPGTLTKPQLIGNQVTNNYLSMNSPENYDYQISDVSGRLLSKGVIAKGFTSIHTGNIPQGVYIIQLSNGYDQWSYKFVKQ